MTRGLKRAIILGATGQLGQAIVRVWSDYLKLNVVPREIDIRNSEELQYFIKDHITKSEKAMVINCVAMTDVDRCELEPDLAMDINYRAVKELANICRDLNVGLIHIGTDFVFDGTDPPYHEEKKPNPINQYGRSKWLGEKAVLDAEFWVCRVSWLFGKDGRDFPSRLIHRYLEGERNFRIAYDLVGTPTWATRAAHIILLYHDFFYNYPSAKYKLLHSTNSGSISKYELACYCFQVLNIQDIKIEPILSSEYPVPAPRPKNTSMTSIVMGKLNFTVRHFTEDLQTYLWSLYNKYGGLRGNT